MTKGEDLYRLQRLDSERDGKQQRLVEVEAALEDDSALRQAQQAFEDAERRVHKRRAKQRELELEREGLSDRISRSERRLYSGKVNNPKELSDLQAEVASLQRRRQRLEDDLLETMIEREEAEKALDQATRQLSEVESRRSARQADLRAEREELEARLAEIEGEREALLPRIEADDLAIYDDLRDRKSGRAVVRVRDGACGGCGVTVSSTVEWELRKGKIVFCDTCGRMIVSA